MKGTVGELKGHYLYCSHSHDWMICSVQDCNGNTIFRIQCERLAEGACPRLGQLSVLESQGTW